MNVIILESALDDLVDLETYFERISVRLAKRFRKCVERTLEIIVDFPRAQPSFATASEFAPLLGFVATAFCIEFAAKQS